ncbi:hypothetical protein [Hyalangium gracile]|uniref:hypothetical protein n=1 Tax=Hyalangium gracile TaxID=394092 RepID=UPI001CCF4607|nr:hypothetical protein [Hyalangium gracile]
MRRGWRYGWLMLVALLGTGCSIGLGERCETDGDCADELVCSKPSQGNEPAPSGVCDYPRRGLDEPCTVSAECEASLTCSNHFTPGDRYGKCVAPREEGSACFADRDCVSGTCEGASGSALDGTCAPP